MLSKDIRIKNTAFRWSKRLLMLSVLLLVLSGKNAFARKKQWTSTWGTSNVRDSSGRALSDETVRQVIHTSIGGVAVRVIFSNCFGTGPLHLDDVQIALRTSGSGISTDTQRQLRFAGATDISIPAGAEATSDPLPFRVEPLSDLVISFHLPHRTPLMTLHTTAHQTGYMISGDASTVAQFPEATETRSYLFLSSIQVDNPKSLGTIVTLGASITDGTSSTDDANRRWPDFLAQRLQHAGLQFGVVNAGIGGNRLLRDGSGESAKSRFDRDVLQQANVRWVIFSDDPINDLGGEPSPRSSELIAALRQLIKTAHDHGVRFGCSVLTPYEGAKYWRPEGEIQRRAYNEFVRSPGSGCDLIMDQDLAIHDPEHVQRFLPEYDRGDHLHPNDKGMEAIANSLDFKALANSGNRAYGKP